MALIAIGVGEYDAGLRRGAGGTELPGRQQAAGLVDAIAGHGEVRRIPPS
jgi:hypothetical protein